jgi:hypothetical protein
VHLCAMSDAVVAALVAGVVSLSVTFGKAFWDHRRLRQEQRLAAREKLDRYRAPLLAAADDLGSRINNIRNDGFLVYFRVEGRERAALLGTLYRFAQFFAWSEILYGYSDRLRFESDDSTREVAEILRSIGRTLAVDRLDRADPPDFTTTQLMLWREEQRAIGEMMREEGDPPRCIGFASFVTDYESRYEPWFRTFASQVDAARTPRSDRLAELQRLLARLVQELDVDEVLVNVDSKAQVTEPRWARPSMLPTHSKAIAGGMR